MHAIGKQIHAACSPLLTYDAQAQRLQKHNEAEARRRKKLNETFQVLRSLCGCPKRQQSAILHSAIAAIQELHEVAKRLQYENEVLLRQNQVLQVLQQVQPHQQDQIQNSNGALIGKDANGVERIDHRAVFENSKIPQAIYSPSGNFLTWNQAFVSLLGYDDA